MIDKLAPLMERLTHLTVEDVLDDWWVLLARLADRGLKLPTRNLIIEGRACSHRSSEALESLASVISSMPSLKKVALPFKLSHQDIGTIFSNCEHLEYLSLHDITESFDCSHLDVLPLLSKTKVGANMKLTGPGCFIVSLELIRGEDLAEKDILALLDELSRLGLRGTMPPNVFAELLGEFTTRDTFLSVFDYLQSTASNPHPLVPPLKLLNPYLPAKFWILAVSCLQKYDSFQRCVELFGNPSQASQPTMLDVVVAMRVFPADLADAILINHYGDGDAIKVQEPQKLGDIKQNVRLFQLFSSPEALRWLLSKMEEEVAYEAICTVGPKEIDHPPIMRILANGLLELLPNAKRFSLEEAQLSTIIERIDPIHPVAAASVLGQLVDDPDILNGWINLLEQRGVMPDFANMPRRPRDLFRRMGNAVSNISDGGLKEICTILIKFSTAFVKIYLESEDLDMLLQHDTTLPNLIKFLHHFLVKVAKRNEVSLLTTLEESVEKVFAPIMRLLAEKGIGASQYLIHSLSGMKNASESSGLLEMCLGLDFDPQLPGYALRENGFGLAKSLVLPRCNAFIAPCLPYLTESSLNAPTIRVADNMNVSFIDFLFSEYNSATKLTEEFIRDLVQRGGKISLPFDFAIPHGRLLYNQPSVELYEYVLHQLGRNE